MSVSFNIVNKLKRKALEAREETFPPTICSVKALEL